jgi:nucleotide-binding universal stress UspA family protein
VIAGVDGTPASTAVLPTALQWANLLEEGLQAYLWEHPACLVVVAFHARSGPSRVVFGKVTAAVVRSGMSPVLVVPRPEAR